MSLPVPLPSGAGAELLIEAQKNVRSGNRIQTQRLDGPVPPTEANARPHSLGGPGSGNFGHGGRPGQVGGSSSVERNDKGEGAVFIGYMEGFGEPVPMYNIDREDKDETKGHGHTVLEDTLRERGIPFKNPKPGIYDSKGRWIAPIQTIAERPHGPWDTNIRIAGGPGSGNFGHGGRPGEIGGSASSLQDIANISLPHDDDRYEYFYHSFRNRSDADKVETTGLKLGNAGKAWLSKDEIRDRGAGFAIVKVPKGVAKESLDRVEDGLTYRQFTVASNLPASAIVRVVREIPTGSGGHSIREDQLATYALTGVPLAPEDQRDLPKKYHSWFKSLGGPGSGNFGHEGRPGEVGGSSSEGSSSDKLEAERKFGVEKVGKLLDKAIKTADFDQVGGKLSWEDLGPEGQEDTHKAYIANYVDNYDGDAIYHDIASSLRYELDENPEPAFVERVIAATKEKLGIELDPDKVDLSGGVLMLTVIKADGTEATGSERAKIKELYKDERLSYIEEKMNSAAGREMVDAAIQEEALASWENLSDSHKLDLAEENEPGITKTPISVPGAPTQWMVDADIDRDNGVPVDPDERESYAKTRIVARRLTELRTNEIAESRGLGNVDGDRIARVTWGEWKTSSTSPMGLALQYAAAEELGGVHRLTDEEIEVAKREVSDNFVHTSDPNRAGDLGFSSPEDMAMERLKSYVRAQWETTQFVMDKASKDEAELYRALVVPKSELDKTKNELDEGGFVRLPDLALLRNGAASTTSKADVANEWLGVGKNQIKIHPTKDLNDRIVVRFKVPRTSIISLPVFGENVIGESEYVLAGTKDKWEWDAWRSEAPEFHVLPVSRRKLKAAAKVVDGKLVIDLLDEDRGQPHWLTEIRKQPTSKPEKKGRFAARAIETAVHRAADLYQPKLQKAIMPALVAARAVLSPNKVRSIIAAKDKKAARSLTASALAMLATKLKRVLPSLMLDTLEAGGNAGISRISSLLKTAGGEGSGNFGHAGRPGEVGGSAEEGASASGGDSLMHAKLAEESKTGVEAVRKLLDRAVREAEMPDSEESEASSWSDVKDSVQDEAYDHFVNSNFENGVDVDTSDLDADIKKDLQRDNEKVVKAATSDFLGAFENRTRNKIEETLPLEPSFDLKGRQIDPETIEYEEDDGDGSPLVSESLRYTDGSELSKEDADLASEIWDEQYTDAFEHQLSKEFESDSYSERRNDLEIEAIRNEWDSMSDKQKLSYAYDQDLDVSSENSSSNINVRLPDNWVSGVEIGTISDEDYARSGAIARKLTELRAEEILKERGLFRLSPNLIPETWDSWKSSSTSPMGLALQLAAARELGGHHRLTHEETVKAEAAAAIYDGMPAMQAYVRAQWETTQMVMEEAGEETATVYRGLMLPGSQVSSAKTEWTDKNGNLPKIWDPIGPNDSEVRFSVGEHNLSVEIGVGEEPQDAVNNYLAAKYLSLGLNGKLTDIALQRGGAQSTTGTLSVANNWNGVGKRPENATRVVLRMEVPRTSIISLPIYGQNEQEEHEVVVAGTKDRWSWDAWRGKAPDIRTKPIHKKEGQLLKAAAQKIVIDLQDIDRDQPHWLSEIGDGAVIRYEEKRRLEKLRTAVTKISFKFDRDTNVSRDWIEKHTAELVTNISKSTRKEIASAMADGFEGGDLDDAEDRIADAVGDDTRGYLIARNEAMTIANEGQRQAWGQAIEEGLLPETGMEREWITTEIGACIRCEGLNGERAPIDGEYPDPGGMGPQLHVGCRCTEGLVAAR